MFSKVALYSTVALATFAAAAPGGGGDSQCNTGTIYCCNSVQSASDPTVATLLGLLGIVVSPVNALVGLTCNPISIIGIGSNSCTAQAACCTGNNFNGLVVVGCSPINL